MIRTGFTIMSAVSSGRFLGPDQTFLFDSHQIDKIYAVGYQDEEQMQFKTRVDAALSELRKKENKEQRDE